MKNCPHCSAPCGDNDRFCSNCGSPLPLGPTVQKTDAPSDFFGHVQKTTPPTDTPPTDHAGSGAGAPPQAEHTPPSGTGYGAPGNAAMNGNAGFGYGAQSGYDPYRGQQTGNGGYCAGGYNPYYYAPQPQAPVQNEGSGFGYGCLGFFFPLVGLILFLVWRKEHPTRSKSAGIGALIRVILTFAIPMFFIFLSIFMGIASCGEVYDDPYYYSAVTSLCRLLFWR